MRAYSYWFTFFFYYWKHVSKLWYTRHPFLIPQYSMLSVYPSFAHLYPTITPLLSSISLKTHGIIDDWRPWTFKEAALINTISVLPYRSDLLLFRQLRHPLKHSNHHYPLPLSAVYSFLRHLHDVLNSTSETRRLFFFGWIRQLFCITFIFFFFVFGF